MLVPEPARLVAHFCELRAAFERDMSLGLDRLLAQLTSYELAPKTRARLATLHEHLGRHTQRLGALLGAAGLIAAGSEIEPARDTTLCVDGLMEHYAQIHRDWGWDESGGEEARQARELVGAMLGDRDLGKLLVLGAGACRLTQDLHHRHRAAATLALDINPLPFLVAAAILRGERVPLYEFSPWPRDSQSLYADRTLQSALPPVRDLHLVFANALAPPVPARSFDTVLTPWFIDQVSLDLRQLVRRISALLPVGGRWIQFGPLLYEQAQTELPERYCVDEVLELVEDEGFVLQRHSFTRVSYLASPISCQGRTETVLTFSAEKREEPRAHVASTPRDWPGDPASPIPCRAELASYRAEHPMFQAIADLIDGERSAKDIAQVMVQRHGLPKDAALSAVETSLRAIARKAAGQGRGS